MNRIIPDVLSVELGLEVEVESDGLALAPEGLGLVAGSPEGLGVWLGSEGLGVGLGLEGLVPGLTFEGLEGVVGSLELGLGVLPDGLGVGLGFGLGAGGFVLGLGLEGLGVSLAVVV